MGRDHDAIPPPLLKRLQQRDKPFGPVAPGMLPGVGHAVGRIEFQRTEDGPKEIVIQQAGLPLLHHIDRTGDRIGRDRHAAGHGFEQHQAEGIRQAWGFIRNSS